MLPRIERYELANEIGHGGMATVYRARDTRLDRWVAVKVMHPHLRGTEQARVRFSREARAVARLRHRAILEIYDYSGNDSENAYIATELLTGPTLRAFLERVGEVPPEIAACIGAELAAALAAAHAQGIVHRDVKPENVLLHEDRTVKLTDFGIADMLDPSMSAMTATGQILGSPAHMAPEQVETGDSDARSDVFALGTILYWLATGTLPFSGKNPHQVLKRVVDCKPADPLTLRPGLGRPLRDVICRCLEKSPSARYQSALELATELERVLRAVGVDDTHATLAGYLRDPSGEAPRLQQRVMGVLLEDARRQVSLKNRPRAIELLDRVLTLSDGNPEALALVAQLDRVARMRFVLRVAFALCAIGGLGWLWSAHAPSSGALAVRSVPTVKAPDAEGPRAKVDQRAQGEAPPQFRLPSESEARPRADVTRPPRRGRDAGKSRTIIFDPEPENVTISVDGADPRPFGPSFGKIDLSPGLHRFRFVGAHQCCEDRLLEFDVAPGPGETVVSAKLEFRPARLYVRSDVAADVVLDDGWRKGRTRELLVVPIVKTLVERHRISVTAAGYKPHNGYVEVRAGEVRELDISLESSAPP